MRPDLKRRLFGQHFLVDQEIIHAIVDEANRQMKEHDVKQLVEIGPGQGAITLPLVDALKNHRSAPRLILCEKDHAFANQWKDQKFEVNEGDFLDLNHQKLFDQTTGIVANLPYSAGTPIVVELAKHFQTIRFMILMFQKEVADRLTAQPRSRDRGSLTLLIQNSWNISTLLEVPPQAFSPPPKVDSTVLLLLPRKEPRLNNSTNNQSDRDLLDRFLRDVFSQKRKMLRAAVRPFPELTRALSHTDIDPTLRAEALSDPQWIAFWDAFRAQF